MSLSKVEIKTLANHYLHLGNGDALAQNQEALDSFPLKEQREIATGMVLNCPEKDLGQLRGALSAIEPIIPTEENCFYHVLNRGLETRSKIRGLSLYDKRHKTPHNLLLGIDFSAALFNEFAELSLRLLDKKEIDIATKLALSTPPTERSKLIQNAQNAFPDSLLVTKLGAAFTLRRELDKLLGDAPHTFFLSEEFDKKSYLEFAELFQLIDDKEDDIAAKMASTPDVDRDTVLEKMAAIFPGSTLLEKTTALFAAPIKITAPRIGMFVASPTVTSKEQKDTTPSPTF